MLFSRLYCAVLALIIAAAAAPSALAASPAADFLITNGHIYTADKKQGWAETVGVKDGKIIYVGTTAGSGAVKGAATKILDLKGKTVLPSFIDGHNHVHGAAEILFYLDLQQQNSVAELQAALKRYRAENPDMKILWAVGWTNIENDAKQRGSMPKQLIDEAVSDIPVSIIADNHHNMAVNSKALELAGVNENTPDPEGGMIIHNPATGEPNGILRERPAHAVVVKGPFFTVSQYKKVIEYWQKIAAQDGISAVFVPLGMNPDNVLKAFQEMDRENTLTAYYDLALWADPSKGAEQVAHFKALRRQYQGKHYKIDSAKIFSDGLDDNKLIWRQDRLEEVVAALDKEKFRIHVHAIGTPNFHPYNNVLDAFAFAQKQNGKRDARHVITHLDWVAEQDIPRFKALDIAAVLQPAWFGKDWYDSFPADKINDKYRFASFIKAGIFVAGSSDFPSSTTYLTDMYPFSAIEAGMTRRPLGSAPGQEPQKPRNDAEKGKFTDLLTAYTLNGAQLLFSEKTRGSIEKGKSADFIVLDTDPFQTPAHNMGKIKVLANFFEGKEIYRDAAFR